MTPLSGKPGRLYPGDTIGLVAPAGLFEQNLLDAGARKWEQLGFRVRVADEARGRHRMMAGTDAARARSINAMLADPEVGAVVCVRGGYGTMRIADRIDWEAAREPKVFMGFSDVTFLLAAWRAETGAVCFHGPMAANLSFIGQDDARDAFLIDLLTRPESPPPIEGEGIVALRPGSAEGVLTGGCLSLVVATIGTPWEIDTAGAVLFLEDTGEPLYRFDRMLTHLRLAGKLDGLRAIAVGNTGLPDADVAESIDELLEGRPIPVIAGLPCGHGRVNVPLPLGVRVAVTTDPPALRFLEGAVR